MIYNNCRKFFVSFHNVNAAQINLNVYSQITISNSTQLTFSINNQIASTYLFYIFQNICRIKINHEAVLFQICFGFSFENMIPICNTNIKKGEWQHCIKISVLGIRKPYGNVIPIWQRKSLEYFYSFFSTGIGGTI